MATWTLADLVEKVGDEINRRNEDTAIRRCIEQTTDRANRLLRARWMFCRASAPVSIQVADGDEYLALGDDFAGLTEARFIDAAGVATDLAFLNHREAADRAQELSTGSPLYYAIYANQVRLLPRADRAGTLEMWTYERFGLVDDDDTNWLLKHHRDVYLNGATYFMKRRLRHPQGEIEDYRDEFLAGIREVRTSQAFDAHGGTRAEPVEYF